MYEQRYRNTRQIIDSSHKAISGAPHVWLIMFIKKVQLLAFLFCAFVVLCLLFLNYSVYNQK